MCPLEKCLFSFSAHFLIEFFVVVVDVSNELFMYLEIKPLLVTSFVVFSPIL